MPNLSKMSLLVARLLVLCLWLAPSLVIHIRCQPRNLLFEAYSSHNRLSLDPTFPDEQRLIYELLAAYDTAARPVFNASKNVIIDLSLSLIQISDMDERNQILTANVWIEQVKQFDYLSLQWFQLN